MIHLDQLGTISSWITIPVIAILTLCLLVGIPLARKAGLRAAGLAKADNTSVSERGKDRVAMFAALAPSVLVWLAVMGVSFIGLTGFAADFMQWRHWTNILVPLSLDGISVSFGGWAFVAVKRGRHPGRSYRIVLAAASLSATLNFVHGRQVWSIWAGIYLAFLSLAGMAMFHEMLDQFMANYDDEIARNAPYPRFGQRWLWAPISTLKARRAWIVYPPREGTRPTVNNALDHWRAVKRMSRVQRIDDDATWISERQSKKETVGRPDVLSREIPPSLSSAHIDELPEPLGGNDRAETAAVGTRPDAVSRRRPVHEEPEGEARRSGAPGEGREGKRTWTRSASNAEVNAAAEQLWIEHKRQGTELTGAQLLQLFELQYPHSRRRIRWAAHRRKAAQARFAENDAVHEEELGAETSASLEESRSPDRLPQPTS